MENGGILNAIQIFITKFFPNFLEKNTLYDLCKKYFIETKIYRKTIIEKQFIEFFPYNMEICHLNELRKILRCRRCVYFFILFLRQMFLPIYLLYISNLIGGLVRVITCQYGQLNN